MTELQQEPVDADAQIREASWRQFFETSQMLTNRLEQLLRKDTALRLADYDVCQLLYNAPDHRMRLGDIAHIMVFSPSRLSYQVGVLCDKGGLRRIEDVSDGRAAFAELTSHGLDVFLKAREAHRGHVDALIKDLVSVEEAQIVEQLFARVRKRLLEG